VAAPKIVLDGDPIEGAVCSAGINNHRSKNKYSWVQPKIDTNLQRRQKINMSIKLCKADGASRPKRSGEYVGLHPSKYRIVVICYCDRDAQATTLEKSQR